MRDGVVVVSFDCEEKQRRMQWWQIAAEAVGSYQMKWSWTAGTSGARTRWFDNQNDTNASVNFFSFVKIELLPS